VRIGGTVVAQSRYRIFINMEEKMMEERNRMKILIAYDGSEGAESAIDDLKRAGLPRHAEAIVLTMPFNLCKRNTLLDRIIGMNERGGGRVA
jgi:hypothetical protein